MKKIVALVLSLAMALSLCTVAFAATKVGNKDKVYSTPNKDAEVYTYYTATSDDDYEAGSYDNHLAYLQGDNDMYKVGDDALYVAGGDKADIGLGKAAKKTDLFYEYKAEKVKAQDWSCTTDKYVAGYKYVDENGDTMYARDLKANETADVALLVNGKVLNVKVQVEGKDYVEGGHVLTAKNGEPKATDRVGVYEAYCVACKSTVLVAKTKISEKAYLYDTKWDLADYDYAIPAGHEKLTGTWYVIEAKGASTTTKDGVNSAKTFDAGVAMYVGMSLLSVAGGAVVIGKKKEF